MLIKFTNPNGEQDELYIDENLHKNVRDIQNAVLNRGWDYPAIVCGFCGVGKSTFAQGFCKALDNTFNIDRICFTAQEFVEKTSTGTKGQAFMLDESFADLNSKASSSPDFIKIINHLQLIRQRGLYLILILPDFFSLSKNVAIFRANHLFVVYHDNYQRGRFCAFDRDRKRTLYLKGKQFLNYQCVPPNFRGRFTKKWVVSEELYEKRKYEHLISQSGGERNSNVRASRQRDKILAYCKLILNLPTEKLSEICVMSNHLVNESALREKEDILKRYGGNSGN